MEYLIGKRERATWIKETSFGSGGTMTGGEVVGEDVTITPNFTQGFQETISAGTDTRAVEDFTAGPQSLKYTMKFNPVNWRWLKYLYDVADGGSYTHTFTLANTLNTYKLEWAKQHTTDHVFTIIGNVFKSATMRFAKTNSGGTDGKITVEADCVAKSLTQGSSVTSVSALTKRAFQYRMAKVTLNNAEVVEVNNGEITFDNGINEEDSRYCNSTNDRAIGEPIPGVYRITGRFNVNVKDKTYYDLWATADAISNCKLEIIRTASSDQLVGTFSGFHLLEAVAPTNLQGVTNVDLVFAATGFTSLVATDDIATY
jgi:hypothetical protein